MSGFSFSGDTSFSGEMDFGGSGGGSYTITRGSTFGDRSMERLVRPFITVDSSPPPPAKPKRAVPGADTAASICVGGPSRFSVPSQLENPYPTSRSWSVTATFPEDDDPGSDPASTIRVHREIARSVSVIRVENPEDAAQYVDLEVIDVIDFLSPEGIVNRFMLENG